MYIRASISGFFTMLINELNLTYKCIYDDYYKIDKLCAKYKIKNGELPLDGFNKCISEYTGSYLENDQGIIYCIISRLHASVKIDSGKPYLKLSFVNSLQ